MSYRPHQFLSEVGRVLTELAHDGSVDSVYSLWCAANFGRPRETISESLEGWITVFSTEEFFQLLPSHAVEALREHVRTFLLEDLEWSNKTTLAVEGTLSAWDRALLSGGYYDDPAAKFYPDSLIDDRIRWRNIRRLWVVIAAAIGSHRINLLKGQAQSIVQAHSILGPTSSWPRLQWPDKGEDFGLG